MTDLKVDNFPKRHIIVYVYCLAGDLIGYLIALLMYVIFGGKLIWENGLWCAVLDASLWCRKIAKGFAGGAVGHGGWFRMSLIGGDGIDTELETHEHLHVEQYEVVMLLVFIVLIGWTIRAVHLGTLAATWSILLGYWAIGGFLGTVAAWAVAWMRGESMYRGNMMEEGAYGLDNAALRAIFKARRKQDV
jgi:hypothetical protein